MHVLLNQEPKPRFQITIKYSTPSYAVILHFLILLFQVQLQHIHGLRASRLRRAPPASSMSQDFSLAFSR